MKNALLIISLSAALLALPAIAQQNHGTGSGGEQNKEAKAPHEKHGAFDCSKAKDAERCKMHQQDRDKARETCKGKDREERQQCMHAQAQTVDCSKERNPQHCEARKQATAACAGQSGAQFRQCVEQKMPPVDCSKMPDSARCEQHQKARDLCKDKTGSEHRQCLRENLDPKK